MLPFTGMNWHKEARALKTKIKLILEHGGQPYKHPGMLRQSDLAVYTKMEKFLLIKREGRWIYPNMPLIRRWCSVTTDEGFEKYLQWLRRQKWIVKKGAQWIEEAERQEMTYEEINDYLEKQLEQEEKQYQRRISKRSPKETSRKNFTKRGKSKKAIKDIDFVGVLKGEIDIDEIDKMQDEITEEE